MDDRTKGEELIRSLDEELARCRERAQRLETVFQAAGDGIVLTDLRGAFIEVNDAFCRLVDYTPEELRQINPADLLAPEDRVAIPADTAFLQAQGGRLQQKTLLRKDGSRLPVEVNARLVRRGGGDRVVSTVRDVGARKRAAAEGDRLRDFYGGIVDNIVDGVWVAGADDVILYANPAMAAIAGVPVRKIVGADVLKDFPESTLAQFRPFYLRAKADGAPVRYDGIFVTTPAGRQSIQSGWLVPLRDGARLSAVICTVEDITERTQSERALRESEQRLRLLTDALPMLVSYVDRTEHYRFANAAYEAWFGLAPDQVIGRTVVDVVGTEAYERIRDYVRRALAGERVRYLVHMPYGRGPARDTETIFIPHRGEGGEVLGFHALVQDVSELVEHQRAEQALRISEERLVLSQAVAGIGSFDWQLATGRIIWTAELERLYGLGPGEYPGTYEAWLRRIHPDDRAPVEGSIRKAIAEGREWRAEYRICREDKAVRWMFALGRPLCDEEGRCSRFVGVNLDISERKEAEEALREREADLRDAQRLAHVGSAKLIVATGALDWSEEMYRIYGLDPAMPPPPLEERGDLYTPESRKRLLAALAKALRDGTPYEIDLEIVRPTGEHRWITIRAEVWRDAAGAICGVRGTALDITERKRAAEALERSERVVRTILDHLPVGVSLRDREGRVIETNPAIERIWGGVRRVGVDEYGQYKAWRPGTGEPIEPHAWASARAVERGEITLNEVLEIEGFDGIRRTVLNSAVPVRDGEGQITGAVVVLQDITESQQRERELRDLNRDLEQTVAELRATQRQVVQSEKLAAVGTLAAGVAHELNNPLQGVMGYVGLSLAQTQEPEIRESLQKAHRELERMRDLLKNMLGFARPVVEGSALVPVDVATVLKRTLELVQPEFRARGIRVVMDPAAELPAVAARESLLQQVFLNLLLNARDALEGWPEPAVLIHLGYRQGAVRIEVADTGAGVPAALRERIFDPFFTTKPPGKGTGLGLSIARNIVAGLGGSLTCCGEGEGRGASFVVTLPVGAPVEKERGQ